MLTRSLTLPPAAARRPPPPAARCPLPAAASRPLPAAACCRSPPYKLAQRRGNAYANFCCVLASALHGEINVIKILNLVLQDIELHNACKCVDKTKTCSCGGLTVVPLVDIMSLVLPDLNVPGKPAVEYSTAALNGNDSIKLLNSFVAIVCQLFGITEEEATAEPTEAEESAQTASLELLWAEITAARADDKARVVAPPPVFVCNIVILCNNIVCMFVADDRRRAAECRDERAAPRHPRRRQRAGTGAGGGRVQG
jgi:hypothetical protein